jgi:hypothetical protein
MSCPFKDILGKPGTGVHSVRIFGLALFDILLTIIGAWFIRKRLYPKTPYYKVLFWFFVLGELLHVLFCVKTTISNKFS